MFVSDIVGTFLGYVIHFFEKILDSFDGWILRLFS